MTDQLHTYTICESCGATVRASRHSQDDCETIRKLRKAILDAPMKPERLEEIRLLIPQVEENNTALVRVQQLLNEEYKNVLEYADHCYILDTIGTARAFSVQLICATNELLADIERIHKAIEVHKEWNFAPKFRDLELYKALDPAL